MIDILLDKLQSDALFNFLWFILGSLGVFLLNKLKEIRKRFFLRKELKRIKNNDKTKVIDIANGDPDFSNENIFVRTVDLFGKTKSLYISLPIEYKEEIQKKEMILGYKGHQKTRFFDDISFDGTSNYKDLSEITQIENLQELIEKHRNIVGKQFVNNEKGILFNGSKYGIFNLEIKRFGEDEKPGVNLELFETDYFTHRVFRSIYYELKEKNHPIIFINSHNFLKYSPFFTSFGINAVLITNGEKGNEIVLTKRSKSVNSDNELFHISMNEGFSQTDKDAFGKLDLELCFKRGLLEELGIKENIYKKASYGAFYDFFIDMKNFEIGLTSVLKLDLNFIKDINPLIARDKTLESSEFITIPLNKKSIKDFIEKNEMIPHGKYTLERVLLRENISLS